MKKSAFILSLAAAALLPLSADSAGLESICDLTSQTAVSISDKTYRITYKTDPQQLIVSEPFTVHLLICTVEGIPFDGDLKVSAAMPKHKHGMNFAPKVSKLSPGSYQVEAMVFHMPGAWGYEFSLAEGGKTTRLLSDHLLK